MTYGSHRSADTDKGLSRRRLLRATASAGVVVGVGAIGGVAMRKLDGSAVTPALAQPRPAARPGAQKFEIAPGELDEYYVFSFSGQTGEVRIVGIPSMRELMRIPVFNRCSASGWGQTNESLKILTAGLTPETRKRLKSRGGVWQNGDCHHPHMSFTDGAYDGRYIFVNDKANTRLARIRTDIMKCDKMIELPNQYTADGCSR